MTNSQDLVVVPFVRPAEIAAGRSRKLAAVVILKRLRVILDGAKFYDSVCGRIADVKVGRLAIMFHADDAGVCFRIDGPEPGPPSMSGYIDPRRPGQYVGGCLHVMSWRRGWERMLFD